MLFLAENSLEPSSAGGGYFAYILLWYFSNPMKSLTAFLPINRCPLPCPWTPPLPSLFCGFVCYQKLVQFQVPRLKTLLPICLLYNTYVTLSFFCREEYARQFGFMGEQLVEELGKGHHSGDVANLPPQFSSQPQYSRNVRQKRKLRKTQGSILLDLALSVFRTD